ncbi:MAG: endonuclease III [Myxococcota bacterium]
MKKQEKASRILEILEALYPKPPIPLDHDDSFQLLVAVVLSAQTTDKKVNEVTPALFDVAGTPQKMAKTPVPRIQALIRQIGLAPRKAKALAGLSQLLLDEHGGEVPADFDALVQLPGVGRKTANVVMAQAFNQPAFPVDTHIQRLAGRWGLSAAKTPDQTEDDLKKIFPRSSWAKLHLQIIFFGREHCPALYHDLAECQICGWAATKKRMLEEARRNVEIRQRGKKTKTKKAGAKNVRATSRTRA